MIRFNCNVKSIQCKLDSECTEATRNEHTDSKDINALYKCEIEKTLGIFEIELQKVSIEVPVLNLESIQSPGQLTSY